MNFRPTAVTLTLLIFATFHSIANPDDPEVFLMNDLLDDDTVLADSTAIHAGNIETDSIANPFILQYSDTVPTFEELLLIEQERLKYPLPIDTSIDVSSSVMPRFYYMPVVYKPYVIGRYNNDSIKIATPSRTTKIPAARWVDEECARHQAMEANLQQFCATYPWVVKLNQESLPEPPKKYVASIDPKSATIKVEELKVNLDEANKEIESIKVNRKNWLHSFTGELKFSQAYISPNWYQGGNNNLNLITGFTWNVKLNPTFYKKVLFENTVQYRLALNSAPNDTLRSYSISEDRLQINTTFGLKAAYRWYYSAKMQFKTQLLQNHPTNSRSTTVAFLSPGELNIGLGMSYNYTTPNNKAKFDVTIAPLSYNLVAYTNNRVTSYPGHKTTSQYGSNFEVKMNWKPVYNITYTTRIFAFTDYQYLQGDWENTISFDINRFLTTTIFIHLHYDSSTKKIEGTDWNKWQLKEILSFGFTYKFNSI